MLAVRSGTTSTPSNPEDSDQMNPAISRVIGESLVPVGVKKDLIDETCESRVLVRPYRGDGGGRKRAGTNTGSRINRRDVTGHRTT
jgi:hypothetical protein